MPEVVDVPGDDEIKPLRFRTGNRNVVLEIASWQFTGAQQGHFVYQGHF